MHTSSPALAIVQPVSSCGYGVTRTWRCTYSLGFMSICCSRDSFLRNASCAESSDRIHPGTHVAPSSMTPMRNDGWRISTPSMINAFSVCMTGSGIER